MKIELTEEQARELASIALRANAWSIMGRAVDALERAGVADRHPLEVNAENRALRAQLAAATGNPRTLESLHRAAVEAEAILRDVQFDCDPRERQPRAVPYDARIAAESWLAAHTPILATP